MERKPVCYVVGAGDFYPRGLAPRAGDLLMAADGGFRHLAGLGLTSDVLIGDFDSLPDRPALARVVELPKEKDDTDLLAALKLGLKQGYAAFHLYGGTGGRVDHTLANIQCLYYLARRGALGFLHDRDSVLCLIEGGELAFDAACRGYVSVFAYAGAARGVALKGLKYELADATLWADCPLGVSNEFTGRPARVSVGEGALLVVYPADAPEPAYARA